MAKCWACCRRDADYRIRLYEARQGLMGEHDLAVALCWECKGNVFRLLVERQEQTKGE